MNKITFNKKIKISDIRQILMLVLLIICYRQNAISQGTDISISGNPSLFVGLSLGPSQSYIKNDLTTSVPDLVSDKKGSFLGFIDIGYFFSKNFGLSSGIGFISDKTELSVNSYQNQNKYTTTDSESESYESRVTGSDIKELQKVGFLSLPFCINLRLPVSEKAGFFLQTGINLTVPLTKNYSSAGKFTYKGYYPAYNAVLENLPTYGFPSDKNNTTDGSLELKQLVFNFTAAGGYDFFIQEKVQIGASICFDKSLSDISNYSSIDKFQLSTDVNQINSLMGGSSKTTVQSLSLKISLRYYLK